ncbi:hypothetical protein DFH06DRAFT_1153178 [Mycena polygramma]|nr:hypothetical protein DFH06DRAFT_1153178 [Mycena polygramma]
MAGAARRPLSLADICRLPPVLQLCAHLDNHWEDAGLYVHEGAGAVYFCGRVLTSILDDFREEHIDRAAFLANLEVKYGFAADLEKRRMAYLECEEGDWTHLWFWAFYTDYRVVAERINHLLFMAEGAPRVLRECDGCHVEHREFWRYADVGDFARLSTQGELVLAALGDVNAYRHLFINLEVYGGHNGLGEDLWVGLRGSTYLGPACKGRDRVRTKMVDAVEGRSCRLLVPSFKEICNYKIF